MSWHSRWHFKVCHILILGPDRFNLVFITYKCGLWELDHWKDLILSGLWTGTKNSNRFENLKYSMYSSSWTCVNSLMATWYISAPSFWFIRFCGSISLLSDRFATFLLPLHIYVFVYLFTNYTIVYSVRLPITTLVTWKGMRFSAMQGIYIKMGLCSIRVFSRWSRYDGSRCLWYWDRDRERGGEECSLYGAFPDKPCQSNSDIFFITADFDFSFSLLSFLRMEEMVKSMMQYKTKIEQLKQEKSSLSITYEVYISVMWA